MKARDVSDGDTSFTHDSYGRVSMDSEDKKKILRASAPSFILVSWIVRYY